jgi:hypothetical protein
MDFHRPSNIYNTEININENELSKEFYTVVGQEEFLEGDNPRRHNDDSHVYAKKIQKKDGTYKTMIRVANNGKLYNPVAIYGEEKSNNFLERVCRANDKFRPVNNKAFEWYIKFLSTKNMAWFYNAEREVD